MNKLALGIVTTSLSLLAASVFSISSASAQQAAPFQRLASSLLDVTAPSARVSGEPGEMRIVERTCRQLPANQVRRRIVDTAVQEWAYFGFNVDDLTIVNEAPPPVIQNNDQQRRRFRRTRIAPQEAERVAGSIGGYWAAAPDSSWILQIQNDAWNGPNGIGSRWRNPWSAAFISWVMCESGLGENEQFTRAIAHYTYIDQAIINREENNTDTVYTAYDPGEEVIIPGDLLCRGSRPSYRSIAQRREQLGIGARTHCDIVVKVDESAGHILTIGGNVRSSVRMKILPAERNANNVLSPLPYSNGRTMFAHLKNNASQIEAEALDNSPTLNAMSCNNVQTPSSMLALNIALSPSSSSDC